MLDLNTMRAEFAAYLTDNFHKSKSLDAALMHVLTRAYEQGMADGRGDCMTAIFPTKEVKL
jgi:hypothetical protein